MPVWEMPTFGSMEISSKEDIEEYVVEPLRGICAELYDLNVETFMSGCDEQEANVKIIVELLSDENLKRLMFMVEKFPQVYQIVEMHKGRKEPECINILMKKQMNTTKEEIDKYFKTALSMLKIQDIKRGFCRDNELIEKVAKTYGLKKEELDEISIDECAKVLGVVYNEEDGLYYEPERLRRHNLFLQNQRKERAGNLHRNEGISH